MEIRRDPVTGRKIIIACKRAERPSDFKGEVKNECPFCRDNEHLTPPTAYIYPEAGPWKIRIVQNKYPVIDSGDEVYTSTDLFLSETGYGTHEVLIETDEHEADYASMSIEHIQQIFKIYVERITYYFQDKMIQYISILKNSGKEAGATLEHPHSQIVALSFVPSLIEPELEGSRNYYKEHKRCVYCDMIKENKTDTARIVYENQHFIAYVPYAGIQAYEVIIMPKRHRSNFEDILPEELRQLVEALKKVYESMKKVLGPFSYNLIIHTGPKNRDETVDSYHYHIQLTARFIQISQYALEAALYVRTTRPEDIAAELRLGKKIER